MRHGMTSLLVAGCISSSAVAFQSRSGGAGAGQACELLTRDLVMKVSSDARKKTLQSEKPVADPYAEELRAAGQPVKPGMSCKYGPVMLVLNPLAKPAQTREALRARTKPYQQFEPVPGVGDAAFFRANSAWASMYVWTGSHHFLVELGGGFLEHMGDARELKANSIELAKSIVSQLR